MTFPYSFGVVGHRPKTGCMARVSRNGRQAERLRLADLSSITVDAYSTLMVEFAGGAYD